MVQAAERTQDVDIVIAIVFETATFIVCVGWPRTAIEKGWSYVNDVVDAETASELRKAAEEIISEPGKWRPAGTINASTAYVGPAASPEIKAMVSELLDTAEVDAGTESVLKDLFGNIERRANSHELCFDGVLFAGRGCIYRVQSDNTGGLHVSLHEYITVGNEAHDPISILNLIFQLEEKDPALFTTVRSCMSAIRYCLESLYGCGNVEVTLLFQGKGRENNWGGFNVWKKRGDKSWRIFKVHNKGDKEEEDGDEEEAEGEMLIKALQKDGDKFIIDSR